MNDHKQVRRIISNCPSCHINIFVSSCQHVHRTISTYSPHYINMFSASCQHLCCQTEKPFPPSDYFNMSSTGQWSLPKISLCMKASHMRSFILSDMRK